MNLGILRRQVKALSAAYPLRVRNDYGCIVVREFRLPPGFNRPRTEVLMGIPSDYPCSPPGIGKHRIYVPRDLRYRGRRLADLHSETTPGWGSWAWLCYQWIKWNPHRDNLLSLMEMVRADLTNPSTR